MNSQETEHEPHLAFNTGTGKPVVPDKRVPRVRVWYPIWHTRAEPRTRGVVSRVRSGIYKGTPATCHCTSMPLVRSSHFTGTGGYFQGNHPQLVTALPCHSYTHRTHGFDRLTYNITERTLNSTFSTTLYHQCLAVEKVEKVLERVGQASPQDSS